jgi:hypothetical protein
MSKFHFLKQCGILPHDCHKNGCLLGALVFLTRAIETIRGIKIT